jgi:hypothetical protein
LKGKSPPKIVARSIQIDRAVLARKNLRRSRRLSSRHDAAGDDNLSAAVAALSSVVELSLANDDSPPEPKSGTENVSSRLR